MVDVRTMDWKLQLKFFDVKSGSLLYRWGVFKGERKMQIFFSKFHRVTVILEIFFI